MLDQTSPPSEQMHLIIDRAIQQIEQIIVGKPSQVRLAVCCLLASGHCLIEDLPGVGKTTLAQALARVFDLNFNRIQFTSDLLPADILGVSIFDPQNQLFNFHPGPIFTNCVLADELNRATPKTQSALLEAMEEHQITVEGETRQLGAPFFVIGTQNPLDQAGTFPLPESQLDRFMMRIHLGYPDQKAERLLLAGQNRHHLLRDIKPVVDAAQVVSLQQSITCVHISDSLLDYVQLLIAATRDNSRFALGLSPRAALALLKAARTWAFMSGRDFVEPADIKAVFASVSNHRLITREHNSKSVNSLVTELIDSIPIP
jgi:MoxR-like ATPase